MNVTSEGVIFTVPQICAYFVDNPHNLEIDLFKIAVSEHILLYFSMDPYSGQNLQKYIHELCADDQLKKSRCLDVLFAIYTSY
jgi:hypothetical protein